MPLSTDVKLRLEEVPSARLPLTAPLTVPTASAVTLPSRVRVLDPVRAVPPRRSRLATLWPAVVAEAKSNVPPPLTYTGAGALAGPS